MEQFYGYSPPANTRRLGDYVNHLKTKYLVLGAAGMIFSVAIVFAILAIFWGLISLNHNPAASADYGRGVGLDWLVDRVYRLWNYAAETTKR